MREKPRKPDRRHYTLMLVPHHGNQVRCLEIPIRYVKAGIAAAGVLGVCLSAGLIHYQYTLNKASSEIAELEQLRQVNGIQATQLDKLAKTTSVLQDEMGRLNQLDAEIRRLLSKEELPGTSRSGVVRPNAVHNGEGGPIVKPRANELINLVSDIQANAKAREESLKKLRGELAERNARLAATPSIFPASGVITSRFGWRWGGSDWHPGIDVAADYGTEIYSTADGVVTFSDWNGGYGRQIAVDHGYGYVTSYAHNSENLVKVGQKVKKGDLIAYMGSTGFSTGPHVHYEVKVNGTVVNPASFLQ